MVKCRFVGGDCSTIGDREFDTVGQVAEFSEAVYKEVLLGGADFLPEHDFNVLGFTEQELEEFGPSGIRLLPTDSFCRKLALAQTRSQEIRQNLLTNADSETLSLASN